MENEDWYFSFGVGHYPHEKSYVKIRGTCDSSREEMIKRFGKRWCFQYKTSEDCGVERHGLTELNVEA